MAAPCLFCTIAAGAAPAHVVFDDDVAVAFLDVKPLFKGHVLVVPRHHVEALPDLPPADVGPLFDRVRRLSAAVPAALDAHGTFVAINNIVSQSMPHLHIHVVPRRRKDGLRGFMWPRLRYVDDAEADDYAARISVAYADTP